MTTSTNLTITTPKADDPKYHSNCKRFNPKRRVISVYITDSENPKYAMVFKAEGNQKRFEDEYFDIMAELNERFEIALEKVFRLQEKKG